MWIKHTRTSKYDQIPQKPLAMFKRVPSLAVGCGPLKDLTTDGLQGWLCSNIMADLRGECCHVSHFIVGQDRMCSREKK